MSRNSSGTYTLPPGINPVIPNTPILATWANPTLTDVASALTDSLSRSGQGGMLAPLRGTDGAVAAPSLSFSSETTTGFYRSATGTVKLSILGTAVLTVDSNGMGAEGISYLPNGTGAIRVDLRTKVRQIVHMNPDYDATGGDYGVALNAAIVYLNSIGGGKVIVPPALTPWNVATSIMLLSGVAIEMYGATLEWTGGASPVFTSPNTGVLQDSVLLGGMVDGGTTATKLVEWNSAYHCATFNTAFTCAKADNIVFDVLGLNTSGGLNRHGNRNNAYNTIVGFSQDGYCGTAMRFMGTSGTVFVTVNTIVGFYASDCRVRGIDFAEWCDSNTFSGNTRIFITAANAVGVEWNTAAPTSNRGVYSNNFQALFVDAFGTPVGDARIGWRMNYTKFNKIDFYFNDPQCVGGAFAITADCQSYDFYWQQAGTANLTHCRKLSYEQGKDSPILGIAADGTITTESVGAIAGVNRTGNGNAYFRLVGDSTYNQYGFQMLRGSTGANANSTLSARGTGNLTIFAEDAGGQVILQSQNGVKFVANNTGIGFNGTGAVAKPTITGSRGGNAALADFLTKMAATGLFVDGTTA